MNRPDAWNPLREFTDARIALGRSGASLPTREVLNFGLAHARARDAIHQPFASQQLVAPLAALGLDALTVHSAAPDRHTYLRRPDLGRQLADESRADLAASRGIILADTKFEFGQAPDGSLVLADEVLTPDSSRYWDAASYTPGHVQPSFDKQIVRNWLTSAASGWDRSSDDPPPSLPADVVERTRARYIEAYELISKKSFADWPDHA